MKRDKYIGQYFGPWAMEGSRFDALLSRYKLANIDEHVATVAAMRAAGDDPYDLDDADDINIRDGVAVVPVIGEVTKYGSSLWGGPSTLHLRERLRGLVNDSSVRAIVLHIDSPGGTVAGVDDLARDIRKHKASKPIVAYIEDLGASAAYWIAASCSEVYASPSAYVGSIGVYSVLVDSSRAADAAGLTFHVVKSGQFKGVEEDGIPLTEDALAEHQRVINSVNNTFINAVAEGRGIALTDVMGWNTGQVWRADEAKSMGLIDDVLDADSVFASLVNGSGFNRAISATGGTAVIKAEDAPMEAAPEETQEPTPAATLTELREALPNSTAEQREDYMLRGLSVEQAVSEFQKQCEMDMEEELDSAKATISDLTNANIELSEKVAALESELEAIKATGGPGIKTVASQVNNPVADHEFVAKVNEFKARHKNHEAWQMAARAFPELHKDYLKFTQEGR